MSRSDEELAGVAVGSATAPSGLFSDPAVQETTFVVLDFEGTTPRGYSPEPIEVAAVGLRRRGDGWERTSSFNALMKPPAHAPLTSFETGQTGITAAMLADRPPAGVVLAQLDGRLRCPPYLLVAHNAAAEGGMIYRYRDHCPRLAITHLLDTVKLARRLLPDSPGYGLDALIDHLAIPRPADRHRAMPDVQVTITLFEHLMDLAAAQPRLGTLVDVARACGATARATLPVQDAIF